MKDIPIGTEIKYDGFRLKVKATEGNAPTCYHCFFSNYIQGNVLGRHEFSCYLHGMACTSHIRKDRRHVIFEMLNKKKNSV